MIIKRLLDLLISIFGLFIFSPIILFFCILIWVQDFNNPFYIPLRVGLNGKEFKMYKLRSMITNADKSGVDSTGNNDSRITKVGHLIRKFKLDEVTQLINVFLGNMSLIGPRPNIKRETDLYTQEERKLLSIKPGITDFSSIIFSDEGEILKDSKDPDISYHQLIRPWKSRLGLFYIVNQGLMLDLKLLYLTVIAIISRNYALSKLSLLLASLNAPKDLVLIALREEKLIPMPPPGLDHIVSSRDI